MIDLSKSKMPNARFIIHNFTYAIPDEIQNETYDFIIFTYSIHHLTDNDKLNLINSLQNNLSDNGKIIIGDVSFKDTPSLKRCMSKFKDIWDYDEHYYTYDFLKKKLKYTTKEYHQISICSGLLILSN